MELNIRRDNPEQIIGLFQLLSATFPDAVPDFVEVNKAGRDGITVEIRPLKHSRTRPQENYYRKYCAEFGGFCGMTPDEMHEELLCQCYGSIEQVTRFGIKRRPVKRSSDAKRTDYSELIETLCRVAAETGYYIPPPVERSP